MSREPGGSGKPSPRVQRTDARRGPSSLHWNTTSLPVFKDKVLELLNIVFLLSEMLNVYTGCFSYGRDVESLSVS